MLLFDHATHTYTNDGIPVVSVTQLLEISGLSDYSSVPKEQLEYSKALGSAVHRGSELYEQGKLDESTVEDVVRKRLNQWLLFLAFAKVKGWISNTKIVEPHLYSALGFAGTPDRIYYRQETASKLFVFIPDIKTGVKTAAAAIQTAGYKILATDFFAQQDVAIKKVLRMAVYLKDDSYEIVEHKDPTDAAIFLSALNLFNYKKKVGIL